MNRFEGYLFTSEELDAHNKEIAGSFDTIESLLERIFIEKAISWTCPHCGIEEIVVEGMENIEKILTETSKYCPDCKRAMDGIDQHEKREDERAEAWQVRNNP